LEDPNVNVLSVSRLRSETGGILDHLPVAAIELVLLQMQEENILMFRPPDETIWLV